MRSVKMLEKYILDKIGNGNWFGFPETRITRPLQLPPTTCFSGVSDDIKDRQFKFELDDRSARVYLTGLSLSG